jgi:ketosteroid isomerase-like protein
MENALQPLVDRLVEAERANDARSLEDALAEDFQFVGPAGFVLDRNQFVHRFDSGDLKTTNFDITGLVFRDHGTHAVAIGVWQQETTYQGRPNNGNFRLTLVFTSDNGQLSPMMGPA